MASTNADGRVSYTEHELKDPELHERLRYQVGRENTPWLVEVGTNYSPSYVSDATSNGSEKASHPEPAPTMDSRSSASPTVADSTARSTVGDGQRTTSQQSASGSPKRQPTKKATPKAMPAKKQARTTVIEEFDDFG